MRKYDNRTKEANIYYNISKERAACEEISEPNKKRIGDMNQKLQVNKWSQNSEIGSGTKMEGPDHMNMNSNNENTGQLEPNGKYDNRQHQEKGNWLADGTCQARFCERVQQSGNFNTRKHQRDQVLLSQEQQSDNNNTYKKIIITIMVNFRSTMHIQSLKEWIVTRMDNKIKLKRASATKIIKLQNQGKISQTLTRQIEMTK